MDLTPIFVVGFLVFGTYKLVELFVRKKERLALIDKLLTGIGDTKQVINLPEINFFKKHDFNALRFACLLMGIGLGCLIAFVIQYSVFGDLSNINMGNWQIRNNVHETQAIIYFSSISLFGGLGLLISYFLERSALNKEK